jgi:pimeloyl-ACP methyl ester carboxylesterase
MAKPTAAVPAEGKYVRANGADIHYLEAGKGEPLLLLHGGLMSNNPIWMGSPALTSPTWTSSRSTSGSSRPTCAGMARREQAAVRSHTRSPMTLALIGARQSDP